MPIDKKIILYAPTFRDNNNVGKGKYKQDLVLDLDTFMENIGDEYILILKLHYLIANSLDLNKYRRKVYDFALYDDIQELYLVSDLLITDYSSVFFDYANLNRPIVFYNHDLEEYRDNLRGFYLDIFNDLPGPITQTQKELEHVIRNITDIQLHYHIRYKEFKNKFCYLDDGLASKRFINAIFEK